MSHLESLGISRSSTKTRKRRPRAETTVNELLDRQRWLVRSTTIAVFALRVIPIVVPLVLRFTLDPLLAREPSWLFGREFSPEQLLAFTVVIGVGVALVRAIGNYFYVALSGRSGHAFVADLRIAMFEHILRLPVAYADRRGTGKILLRFIGDSDALRLWISRTSPAVRADRLLVLILLVAIFFVKWQLAVILLVPLPLLVVAMRRLSPKLRTLTQESRSLQATLTGRFESRLRNLRQAKWFDRGRKSRSPMRQLAKTIAAQNTQRDRHSALVKSMGQFLSFLAVPLLLGFGVWSVWSTAATIGECVAAIWLAAHLAVTLNRLVSAIVIQQKAAVSLERVLRLLERSAERGRSSTLPVFQPQDTSIVCRNLVFCDRGLGSPDSPLDLMLRGPGIASLAPQLNVSAFYELLLGFSRPAAGELLLGSQRIDKVQIASLRKEIGWLPTHPVFFEGTVLENIRLVAPELRRKDIAVLIADTLQDVTEINKWLRKQVGPNGQGLSDEERLRVGICRLLATSPAFVLIEDIGCTDMPASELRRAIQQLSETAIVCVSAVSAERLGICSGDATTFNESDYPSIAHLC